MLKNNPKTYLLILISIILLDLLSYYIKPLIFLSFFFKSLFLIILLTIIRKEKVFLFIIICFFLIIHLIYSSMSLELLPSNVLKFASFIISPFIITKYKTDNYSYNNFILILFIIIVLNTVLGVLGIGKINYGEIDGVSVGVRGLFFSGNELSILFCGIVSLISLSNYRYKIFLIFLLLISSLFISTKSTILFTTIIFIYMLINKINFIQKIALFSTLPLFLFYIFRDRFSILLTRWEFFFNNSENFLEFITSARVNRITTTSNLFNDMSIFELLFGLGSENLKDRLFQISGFFGSFEMDPLDIFFSYGFLGISLYALTWHKCYSLANTKMSKLIIFLFLFLSIISGHFSESSYSSFIIILILFFSNNSPRK